MGPLAFDLFGQTGDPEAGDSINEQALDFTATKEWIVGHPWVSSNYGED